MTIFELSLEPSDFEKPVSCELRETIRRRFAFLAMTAAVSAV